MPARSIGFHTHDGIRLEGRLQVPPVTPRGIAVICHAPEPADGLMPNVLMPSLTRALESSGWASLRFNYRGVGRSHGDPVSGLSYLDDARGAIAYAREALPVDAVAVVGWSAGATIALWACASEGEVDVFVALAPAASPESSGAAPRESLFADWTTRSLVVRGSADRVCLDDDASRLAKMLGADLETIEGADHAFNGRLAEMTALVTWFLR